MDGLTSRTFWQKTSSYKCQFCDKIYASSLMMVGQNIKKKYLMYQIPVKMFKHHIIPNSVPKFAETKDSFFKRVQKN